MASAPKRTTANGIDFAYLEAGEGPLALCLHGFPDSPATFRHLLPALAGAGYHAVAPWMRGYAPTGLAADGGYTVGPLVSDANALHEVLGGGPDAVLITHDWGAVAGWGAPTQAPERWSKTVVANIPPLPVYGKFCMTVPQLKRLFYFWLFQMPQAEAFVTANDFEFIDFLWSYWSPSHDAKEDTAAAKDCLRDPANLAAALAYYRLLADPARFLSPEWAAEHAAVWGAMPSQPTLYLHGTEDGCISLTEENVAEIGSLLSDGSETAFIEGAGHFLIVEKPGEVNARILSFLSQVTG